MQTTKLTTEQLRRISQSIVGGCSVSFSVDLVLGDGAYEAMSEGDREQFTVKTFKNKSFTKRNYECTNVVFCQGIIAPNDYYVECAEAEMMATTVGPLWIESGVRFFGWM